MADRHAVVRLALGRMLAQDLSEAEVELPISADEIATVMRELGGGLVIAKLLDPDAFPDSLFGDFVEFFYTLVLKERRPARDPVEDATS